MKETKKKETLQEKLAKRKYHIPNRFIWWLYYVIMVKFMLRKYRPKVTIKDDINDCKGPCFLVWNHLSRIDHAYVLKAAWPRRVNIVAAWVEFFRSHLAMVFKLNSILPKKNFTQDIPGVKAMLSIINQGGCVCFSPEGMSSIYGTNQPVVPGTGRYLKHFAIPVYFLKLSGQYLANTKVNLDQRTSTRVEAEMSLLFSPEQLKELTAEQIEEKMNEAFRHDDYAWGKENHLKWKTFGRICDHLSDICYRCPRCGAEVQMTAEKDYIKCRACGNGARMNDYYEFEPFDDTCVLPASPSEWVADERRQIIRDIRADENYSISLPVKIGYVPEYHYIKNKQTSELCGDGTITFDHKGIHFAGTKLGEAWSFDLSYSVVYSLIIETDMTHFAFYINGEYHDFYPEEPIVGKLLLLTEEMHRLHYNTWKNFPWNSDMYEDAAL